MKIELGDASFQILNNNTTIPKVTEAISQNTVKDESFFVCNVGDILTKYDTWNQLLPSVQPFYSVRCNDSSVVLRLMASLGAGFNCSSKSEIGRLLDLGIEPERILFGSPVKVASHVKYAARYGVDLVTFDTASELHKIKAYHQNPKLILRLRAEGESAGGGEAMAFGAPASQAGELLEVAAALGLAVVGLSFHAPRDVAANLRSAVAVLSQAEAVGHRLSLVDIGGGFDPDTFSTVAEEISAVLEEEAAELRNVQIVAEPGSFFVKESFKFCTNVQGVRLRAKSADLDVNPVYYVADGVYGVFAKLLGGKSVRPPAPVKGPTKVRSWESCDVLGPTSDSLDVVFEGALLPRMKPGDWLQFPAMGNLYQPNSLKVHYLLEEHHWQRCKELSGLGFGVFDAVKPSDGCRREELRRPLGLSRVVD